MQTIELKKTFQITISIEMGQLKLCIQKIFLKPEKKPFEVSFSRSWHC